jgi:tRNA1Val (adenine37-N6)-methyltransferase
MASFRFKQFTIKQEQSAMKVGTDSILLGSWVNIDSEESILDIGSGTGILALMLAQRSDAQIIDAVEIDENAYEEAVENFENSPWSDRLFCYHASIQEFAKELDEKYDLIIANPPYFNPYDIKSVTKKSIARQTHLLNHLSLLKSTQQLLSPTGMAAFVIPFEMEDFFIDLAKNLKLFIQRITRTKDHINAPYKRSLLEFRFKEKNVISDEIILKNTDTTYTEEFVRLTKDFYL